MLSHKKRRTNSFLHITKNILNLSTLIVLLAPLALLVLLALLVPLTLLTPLPIPDNTIGVPYMLYLLTTSRTIPARRIC